MGEGRPAELREFSFIKVLDDRDQGNIKFAGLVMRCDVMLM